MWILVDEVESVELVGMRVVEVGGKVGVGTDTGEAVEFKRAKLVLVLEDVERKTRL